MTDQPETTTEATPDAAPITTPTEPAPQNTTPDADLTKLQTELATLKKEHEATSAKYERAQADLSKFRTRADEVQTAKSQAEQETEARKQLEERLANLEKDRDAASKNARDAMLRLALYKPLDGDDARIKTALLLAEQEGLIAEDDSINTSALLEKYPFLKPEAAPPASIPGARSETPKSLTRDSIAHMSPEDYAKNREAIHQAMREGRIT